MAGEIVISNLVTVPEKNTDIEKGFKKLKNEKRTSIQCCVRARSAPPAGERVTASLFQPFMVTADSSHLHLYYLIYLSIL